jgi:hypothetical protein
MKQVIFALLIAVTLMVSVSSQARGTAKLDDHRRVSFTVVPDRALTPGQVRDSIVAVARSRDWVLTAEQPGQLTLRNDIRGQFQVVINVSYDVTGMQVDYVSSENLDYKTYHGVPYIHPKYNKWVNLLIKGVNSRLSS